MDIRHVAVINNNMVESVPDQQPKRIPWIFDTWQLSITTWLRVFQTNSRNRTIHQRVHLIMAFQPEEEEEDGAGPTGLSR